MNVYKDRHHIPGSPFKIEVTRNEVGDASKVRVYGEGLYRGYTNQISHFIVDTRDAGKDLTNSSYKYKTHIYIYILIQGI